MNAIVSLLLIAANMFYQSKKQKTKKKTKEQTTTTNNKIRATLQNCGVFSHSGGFKYAIEQILKKYYYFWLNTQVPFDTIVS